MTVAWIGFAGAIVAAAISGFVALRQARMAEGLARLNSDLDAELHRREAIIDRDMNAEEVLARYSAPLAAAAFDLQSRLYNILRKDFFELYGAETPRGEDALRTTVFRLAQYFGWTEILRNEIQFLSFPEDEETREIARLQSEIAQQFLSHEPYGTALMIWSDEQRAIGERMIIEEHGKVTCMGYARFRDRCEDTFAPWCERLRTDLREKSALDRLREVQHALCALVAKLDSKHIRYDPAYLHLA